MTEVPIPVDTRRRIDVETTSCVYWDHIETDWFLYDRDLRHERVKEWIMPTQMSKEILSKEKLATAVLTKKL